MYSPQFLIKKENTCSKAADNVCGSVTSSLVKISPSTNTEPIRRLEMLTSNKLFDGPNAFDKTYKLEKKHLIIIKKFNHS